MLNKGWKLTRAQGPNICWLRSVNILVSFNTILLEFFQICNAAMGYLELLFKPDVNSSTLNCRKVHYV